MKTYITDSQVLEVAESLQSHFEIGSLYSRSTLPEIAQHAREELQERNFPTRKSLCFLIAKLSLNLWQGTIHSIKRSQ